MGEWSDFTLLLRKLGHDMRGPLNILISTSDMLAEGNYGPLTPKQERATARLQRSSTRLLAILDDFMTYIKASASELPLNPQPFDPRAQLALWCEPVREASEAQGLAFHLTTTEGVPQTLQGDETALRRTVQALLWNALAYTAQGEICVGSDWSPETGWRVSVRDSGTGITEQDVPHIFEPFWRGEARPQLPTAGAGLGLPLALALARLMQGDLTLKEAAPGCHFCLQVPLTSAAPMADSRQQADNPVHNQP